MKNRFMDYLNGFTDTEILEHYETLHAPKAPKPLISKNGEIYYLDITCNEIKMARDNESLKKAFIMITKSRAIDAIKTTLMQDLFTIENGDIIYRVMLQNTKALIQCVLTLPTALQNDYLFRYQNIITEIENEYQEAIKSIKESK